MHALVGIIAASLAIGCPFAQSSESAICPTETQDSAGFMAPDTGIYGSISREEASYRELHLPQYPVDALRNEIEGTVFVRVWIQTDTRVGNARIESVTPASASLLGEGLADLVSTWKFNPVAIHGSPIASEVLVPVRFTIRNSPASEVVVRPSILELPFLETIDVVGEPRVAHDIPHPVP